MGGYVVNFVVYTLAMSGLICFALYVYKKVMCGGFRTSGSKQLQIEETMSINPRKSLMIVKAGKERFLIASDIDKTTLISKLENSEQNIIPIKEEIKSDEEVSFDSVLPAIEIQNQDINEKVSHKKNKPVHLEVITDRNPDASGLRRNSYTSKNYKKGSVNIEIGKTKRHGFSTIKEMATKINEL